MNELLTAVKEFNDRHGHNNVFAHFNFAGHVSMVQVSVDQSPNGYTVAEDIETIYKAYCYLDGTHGSQPSIEALTEHFAQWVKEYEHE